MRKILLYALACISMLPLFSSCNEDDGPTSIEPERIARFLDGNESIQISEGSTEILEIPVFINYRHSGPVTVEFEIEGDPSTYKMISDPQFAVIPAEQRRGVILLQAVDNDDFNDPENSITIRIVGVDSGFQLPDGTSIGFEEKTITFNDNDCMPSERDVFIGDITIEDVGYGSYAGSAELSGESCNIVLITGNLPNSSAGLMPTYEFVFTPSGGNDGMGTVSVAKQPYGANFYDGSGTYDSNTGQIVVQYNYTDATGGTIWTGTNIIDLD